MPPGRERLAEERDQAFQDIFDLEAQIDAGEIPPEAGERLRAEYEQAAAEAMKRVLEADDAASCSRPAGARAREH